MTMIERHDPKLNLVGMIDDYEAGELDREQTIAMFQELVNNGMIYSLQGSYQRTARELVDAGKVLIPVNTYRKLAGIR